LFGFVIFYFISIQIYFISSHKCFFVLFKLTTKNYFHSEMTSKSHKYVQRNSK